MSTLQPHLGYATQVWDERIVPALCDYIRIPNKSPEFDPDWAANGHMHHAAELLKNWADAFARTEPVAGYQSEIVELPGRTPVLLFEIGGDPARGTTLLYGHYDKQPEFSGWNEGLAPWTPVLRNNRLYGRGGADDGYAMFASLCAIAALQRQRYQHGRCVVLIEGCEESGSYDLPHYVEALAARIGKPDLVLCLDAECGNYDQLWLTTSLRGMLPGVLTVRVLEQGQHSGAAGGIVPSSFRLLRRVMERIENADTGALHECLHVQIPDQVRNDTRAVATILGNDVIDRYPWAGTTAPHTNNIEELLIANAWEPALATVGLDGAPDITNAGNTLRPQTRAKLVFRLPPSLDAEHAATRVKSILEADPPQGAEVTFDLDTPQTGWHAPPLAPWLHDAAQQASDRYFNAPAVSLSMGGTIPFMKMLGDRFPEVQFFVSGVLGPMSNAHGPNEFLHIDTGKKLTACVADVLAALP